MTVDFPQLFIFGVLCAVLHWLAGRAEITKPLWSRAPGPLDRALRCPACSGFWLGLGLGLLGLRPVLIGHAFTDVLLTGLLGIFATPIFETGFLFALQRSRIDGD